MINGELTLRVGEEAVHFNLNTSLNQSKFESADCKTVETIIPISLQLIFGCNFQNSINENEMNFQYLDHLDCKFLYSSYELKKTVFSLNENSIEKTSSNEEEAKETETSFEGLTLKELPKHLQYAFLEPEQAKPVIISAALTEFEEQKLLKIVRKYKEVIAWSIEDLKGISHSICMHKILLEDNEKTSIEHQRRLNPVMKEVVRKEVLKWLNAGFIYAISDNPSVSPVYVVPKKGGFAMIRNEKNELIPTRIVIGWRVCIDYRKLNIATIKDYYCDAPILGVPLTTHQLAEKPVDIGCPNITFTCLMYRDPFLHI